MTLDQLRNLLKTSPFRPFVIHLADGREFRVHHPDFLSISPTGRTIIVYPQPDSDAFSILDKLLVTELAVEPASSTGVAA